jgi:hypothetical protein
MLRHTALTLVVLSLITAAAQAQEASDTAETSPNPADEGRFRFGINATTGLESVSASGSSISGMMYGLDLRLGWQVDDLLAIYAQSHLSGGSLGTSAGGIEISGATGTLVATVMGEATLIDRFFAGAGLGYGIFNNPSGLALELRAGGYPLMGHGDDGVRRKALMLGVDFRTVFLDGATGTMIMGCLGYESF